MGGDTEVEGRAFMRTFARPEVVRLAAPLMSSYNMPGATEALNTLGLPDDDYILHMTYGLEEGKANHTGDTQLFLTGTVAKYEHPAVACVREMGEELVVRPKQRLLHVHKFAVKKGGWAREINWYGCSMSSLRPLRLFKEVPTVPGRNKVGCIIHGSRDEANLLLSRLRTLQTSSDGIVGATCISVKDVKAMLAILGERYSKLDHFFWHCEQQTDVYAFTGRVVPCGMASRIREFTAAGHSEKDVVAETAFGLGTLRLDDT